MVSAFQGLWRLARSFFVFDFNLRVVHIRHASFCRLKKLFLPLSSRYLDTGWLILISLLLLVGICLDNELVWLWELRALPELAALCGLITHQFAVLPYRAWWLVAIGGRRLTLIPWSSLVLGVVGSEHGETTDEWAIAVGVAIKRLMVVSLVVVRLKRIVCDASTCSNTTFSERACLESINRLPHCRMKWLSQVSKY